MRQVFYDERNINLDYAGAYTVMRLFDDRLLLANTLTGRQAVIRGGRNDLDELRRMLQEGAEEDSLEKLLDGMGLPGQYDVLLQEGMIE